MNFYHKHHDMMDSTINYPLYIFGLVYSSLLGIDLFESQTYNKTRAKKITKNISKANLNAKKVINTESST